MMHRTPAIRLVLSSLTLLVLVSAPAAQGLHIGPASDPAPTHQTPAPPDPTGRRPIRVLPGRHHGVYIKSLTIRADIVDGIATTRISQVFHNAGSRNAEGTWILPLPPGATADNFTMTMNGKQVAGEVMNADKARQIYTSIVRRQRDPGLLEYMGNGCLRARIFPILAKQDMVVEVRYRQVLPMTAGVHHWSFPLRNAHVNGRPAERLNLDLTIKSRKAIKNVYSPSQGVDISRKGDHAARVSLEHKGGQMAGRDLDIFYGLSDQEFGLNLLTHRKADKAGYFVMMLSPKMTWDDSKTMPKCVNFVIDTSGSMTGKKIGQARDAVRFFVNSLNKIDHFNVIPFSTEARPFFQSPVGANPENIKKALAKIADLDARGGTNIEDGITRALSAPIPEIANLVSITVFLTDGMPTVGTTDAEQLLKLVAKNNTHKHRIFVFGVGHDVNTKLLDKIAAQSHGDRDYVREHENIEVKTSALFTKLSHPVMSKVEIKCDGIEGFDIFPKTTPDLFKGTRLLLTGRYKGDGHHSIRVKGIVDGAEKVFVYEGTFPKAAKANDFIPTLWAQRKVAVLLDAIRLNGQNRELLDEIRKLGSEHGIVTPYTSNLVIEEGMSISRFYRRPTRGPGSGVRRGGRGGSYSGPADQAPGAAAAPPKAADVTRITNELRRAGVIGGKDAEKTVKRRLVLKAGDDAYYMGRTPRRLAGPLTGGARAPGAAGPTTPGPSSPGAGTRAAVNYSLALRKLKGSRSVGNGSGRFTSRHIQGHTFHLIGSVWIDGKLKAGMVAKVEKIEAFSDAYFALLKTHPALAKILAFSTRIVVVFGDRVIEVH